MKHILTVRARRERDTAGLARRRWRGIAALCIAASAALVLATGTAAADGRKDHDSRGHKESRKDFGGVVYAMTNDADGNEIVAFIRDDHGRLYPASHSTTSTGGAGGSDVAAIDPLGSQNALVYDEVGELLFAVNAGDDTVTAFDTGDYGLPLKRRAVVDSGGHVPVSLAVSEDRLYVLNAGGTGSIATFEIDDHGGLTLLDTLDLGLPDHGMIGNFDNVNAPGQVGVDALARHLIVTHAGNQEVLFAALDDDGLPQGPIVSTPSPGIVPFAFGVTRYGTTLVAEAATGSVSAYDPPAGIVPMNVTAAAVATGQAATCWIVVHDAGFAYVSNTGSDTLSVFGYTRTGQLMLLDAVAASVSMGGAPTDMTLAEDGEFVYTLDAGTGEISGFRIDRDSGALMHVETQGGLPASAGIQGIAARDF